jgi:hypothetical protein
MKQLLIFAVLSFVSASSSLAATMTPAEWTFETSAFTSVSNVGTAPLSTSIPPEVGTGAATGLHASSSTVWSTPVGDGSTKAFSADHWAQGDYFQFSTTLDLANFTYSSFSVSFNQNGSGSGPKTFALSYSIDGNNFTQFGADYALSAGITWNSTTTQGTQLSFDLSSVTPLNTANTVYFRLVDDSVTTGGSISGGNVGTAGTSRVDDFTISANASPIPEPSFAALGSLGAAALMFRLRKKTS